MVSWGWMGDHMGNPLEQGVLGMSADPKGDFPKHPMASTEAGVLLPFPETVTSPKKSLYQKLDNLLKSRILRIGLGLGVAGGVGLAGYETYLNVPAVHQTVDNALGRFGLVETPVPQVFDNTKDSGVIGNKNIIGITDIKSIEKIETVSTNPTPKHDINVLMPIQGLPPSGKIDYAKEFIGDNNPLLYGLEETKYAKEHNVKDKMVFKGIPKDTVIIAPTDGFLEFFARPEIATARSVDGVSISYKGADGILYQLGISGSGPLKPLIEAKPFMFEQRMSVSARSVNFVKVKRGQPIFTILQTTELTLGIHAWPSGELGVGSSKTYPANINLITLLDDSGQSKLAVLEK